MAGGVLELCKLKASGLVSQKYFVNNFYLPHGGAYRKVDSQATKIILYGICAIAFHPS